MSDRDEIIKAEGENTGIWNDFCQTDGRVCKNFSGKGGGFSGTDIDPMYRAKRMTEAFGPVGQGWGWVVHKEEIIEVQAMVNKRDGGQGKELANVPYHFATVSLWYVLDGERQSFGPVTGGTDLRVPDEAPKCSLTDALGKLMSYLGIGADIYMGQGPSSHTDSKHTNANRSHTDSKYSGGDFKEKPKCPACDSNKAVYESKEPEAGKTHFCWKKKGGCGQNFEPKKDEPKKDPVPPSPSPDHEPPAKKSAPKYIKWIDVMVKERDGERIQACRDKCKDKGELSNGTQVLAVLTACAIAESVTTAEVDGYIAEIDAIDGLVKNARERLMLCVTTRRTEIMGQEANDVFTSKQDDQDVSQL